MKKLEYNFDRNNIPIGKLRGSLNVFNDKNDIDNMIDAISQTIK